MIETRVSMRVSRFFYVVCCALTVATPAFGKPTITGVSDARAAVVTSSANAPDELQLRVDVAAKTLLLNLQINQNLTRQAAPFVADIANGKHRVYNGTIDKNPQSWVRVTLIDGYWVGVIWDGANLWLLDPAIQHLALAHAIGVLDTGTVVFSASDLQMPGGFDDRGVPVPSPAMPARNTSLIAASTVQASTQKYLAMTLVLDTEFQTAYGSSAASQAVAILNVVQGFYAAQVGVDVYLYSLQPLASDGTLTGTDPNSLLTAFGTFVSGGAVPFAGDAHLLSGKDFDGSTIGLGYIGSLCSSNFSLAVVQTTFGAAGSGVVMAHELGHNFGAEHDGDGNSCPSSGFIMQASVNFSSLPTSFSSCSLTYFSDYIAQSSPACIDSATPDIIFANGFD
jgi:hypothetical protein